MYNLKLSGKDSRLNRENEPLDSGLLRVWIMVGGLFAFLAMVIDSASFGNRIGNTFIILLLLGSIAYLLDIYSEQYVFIRRLFVGTYTFLTFSSTLWLLVEQTLSSFALTLYTGVIVGLVYKEYFKT